MQRTIWRDDLYVTHDQVEAMTLADRIGILEQGRLVQVGTPREVYDDPACPLRRSGSARRRSTCCRARSSRRPRCPADTSVVAIRPEDIVLARARCTRVRSI